ncbi:MAG: tyrosine-type recombinase/integrase [Desulfovibrio sp.]|nr:tyrosine-type recombinase/integrase [Desulfovibrio sp.]
MRHLSATILAHAGLDIPTVQAILRHKNPNTTARYIKILGIRPDKRDAVFSKRRGPKITPFEPQKAIGAWCNRKTRNLASPTGFEPVLAA